MSIVSLIVLLNVSHLRFQLQEDYFQDTAKILFCLASGTYSNEINQKVLNEKKFEAIIGKLGHLDLPQPSDRSAAAEVVRIAIYHAKHPLLMAKLENGYVKNGTQSLSETQEIVGKPVDLYFVREEFRLAWEYLYLRPSTGVGPPYRKLAADVLAQLANANTLLLYAELFKTNVDYLNEPEISVDRQKQYMTEISRFISEIGLNSLLQCAISSEISQRTYNPKEKPIPPMEERNSFDPFLFIQDLVLRQPTERDKESWSEVLLKYQRNPANKSKWAALHRVLLAKPRAE